MILFPNTNTLNDTQRIDRGDIVEERDEFAFLCIFFLHALAEVPKSTKKRTFKDNKICYHKK